MYSKNQYSQRKQLRRKKKNLKQDWQPFIQWDCGTVFGSFKCCGLKMNTAIDLEPKLRMRGAVPPNSYAIHVVVLN